MSEDDFPEPKARPTDMQMTVQSSADASAVVALQDPRELPLEERLQHAEEHEQKLKHIMEKVPINIRHLQGSSAGAGSGEFHIYRNARNQEQKRLREMEQRWKAEQEKLIVKRQYEDAQQALESKTARNRAKRQKRKEKKHAKGTLQDSTAATVRNVQPESNTL